MIRFSVLLGTGVLCLVLADVAGASPAAPAADSEAVYLLLEEGDLVPVAQKKAVPRRFSVSNRVKNLSAGSHHVGTTTAGRQVHATANKAGKITSMHVQKTPGKSTQVARSSVHRAAALHPAVKRLPPAKKVAALPAARDGEDAEVVPVRQLAGFAVFVFQIPPITIFLYVPIATLAPSIVIDPEPPPVCGAGDLEARGSEPVGPGQVPALTGRGPELVAVTSRRRARA